MACQIIYSGRSENRNVFLCNVLFTTFHHTRNYCILHIIITIFITDKESWRGFCLWNNSQSWPQIFFFLCSLCWSLTSTWDRRLHRVGKFDLYFINAQALSHSIDKCYKWCNPVPVEPFSEVLEVTAWGLWIGKISL